MFYLLLDNVDITELFFLFTLRCYCQKCSFFFVWEPLMLKFCNEVQKKNTFERKNHFTKKGYPSDDKCK